MSTVATAGMPTPARAYFDAMNNLDSAGMVAVFPADGLVNDIQREFWGPESMKRWADRESVGDRVITARFVEAKGAPRRLHRLRGGRRQIRQDGSAQPAGPDLLLLSGS